MKQNLRRIQFAVMIVFMALSFAIASLTFVRTVSASGAADPLLPYLTGKEKEGPRIDFFY